MYTTVDEEIKKALVKKGYNWQEISIKRSVTDNRLFEVKLDGRLVEFYDPKKKAFFD